jgi:hypothetical protein
MDMNRKGMAPLVWIFLVILAAAVVGGVFLYFHNRGTTAPGVATSTSSTVAVVSTSTLASSTPVSTSTPPTTTTTATVSSFSPHSGPVGTLVTVHGSGFATTNTVELKGLLAGSASSSDGKTFTFTVPPALAPNCAPGEICPMFRVAVSPGAYVIAIISNGATQTIGTFTVTGKGL